MKVKRDAAAEMVRESQNNAARQQERMEAIENDLKKAGEMALSLSKEAEELDREAEEAKAAAETMMERYELARAEADRASEDVTAARIEKNKKENESESILSLLKRVEESIENIALRVSDKKKELASFEEEKNRLLAGAGDLEESIRAKTEEKDDLTAYISQVTEEKTALSALCDKMEREQETLRQQLNTLQDQKYRQEIRKAKNETQLDTLKERLWEDFEVTYLQALDMKKEDFVMSSAQKESRAIRDRIRELGDVNVGSIKEYEQVSERYMFLSRQREDITGAMEQLSVIVNDMEKTIRTRFKENFDQVVVNFEDIFRRLFGGGHAELRLDNDDDPLTAGIEIIAQPPGKKLQNINLMSGGEKTMTAIALMFAVLKTRPTPFCILDEVEAALDDNNIDRFGKYLRNFKDIQFAIITHQKATMEHADVLYGVTMPEQGISRVLSLRLGDDFEL